MAFTYLKVKPAKCLGFLPVSWSYFGLGLVSSGLGLGLVILVLVLRIWSCLHHWTAIRLALFYVILRCYNNLFI